MPYHRSSTVERPLFLQSSFGKDHLQGDQKQCHTEHPFQKHIGQFCGKLGTQQPADKETYTDQGSYP